MAELEAIVAIDGAGSGGEAEFVEYRIHEVAGAVSGEGTAGAISSVGSGREAEDKDSGTGITETWDGSSPVGLVLVGAALGFSDAAAVGTKSGTALAGDDVLVNLREKLRRNLCARRCHCIP